LTEYGVTSIELGSQSMCDDVLLMNNRGHSAEDTKIATRLIKAKGFSVGLQMMTGLYASTHEKDLYTAEEIIKLAPDTVRIYPTITIKNTMLGNLYENGKYIPPALDETTELCAKLTIMFWENNIKVIKTGLHASRELESKMLAGPYHPSFGELVMNEIMLQRLLPQLKGVKSQEILIEVARGEVSKMIGQKRRNLIYLENMGLHVKIIQGDSIPPLSPMIKI
ncbi:MAG: radical SAM protein, partial [Oscillospiraceae bacterium]